MPLKRRFVSDEIKFTCVSLVFIVYQQVTLLSICECFDTKNNIN